VGNNHDETAKTLFARVRLAKKSDGSLWLKTKVKSASLLTDKSKLKFDQKTDGDHHQLTITLPSAAPDKNDSVIALELDGEVEVDTALMQQPGDIVTLPAFLSKVHKTGDGGLRFDTRGVAERWVNKDEWIEWDFKLTKPGDFDVVIVTSEQKYGRDWEGGHVVPWMSRDHG
jgi:hypothetical protein